VLILIDSGLVSSFNQGDKARVIQTLLFVAGINTLLQALFGTRLPAVVGGSFAYVIPVAYIIGDSSLQRINDPHEVSLLLPSHLCQCNDTFFCLGVGFLQFRDAWFICSSIFRPTTIVKVIETGIIMDKLQ
jgi:nucleobase transporter 1/2